MISLLAKWLIPHREQVEDSAQLVQELEIWADLQEQELVQMQVLTLMMMSSMLTSRKFNQK